MLAERQQKEIEQRQAIKQAAEEKQRESILKMNENDEERLRRQWLSERQRLIEDIHHETSSPLDKEAMKQPGTAASPMMVPTSTASVSGGLNEREQQVAGFYEDNCDEKDVMIMNLIDLIIKLLGLDQ